MRRVRQLLIAVLGVGLLGALLGEHANRRAIARRYQEAIDSRRQLVVQIGEMTAGHEQLKGNLERERQRAQELTDTLAASRTQLEDTAGRLTEATRTVSELKTRLAAVQQQMDQVQGELAIALQDSERRPNAGEAGSVQLERIIVSGTTAPGFEGRVLSVHSDWNFIVVDLGWSAVSVGETVSIFRNDQLLAKAKVERVQEEACAATVLPEWTITDIHANDLVRVFGATDAAAGS